MLPLVAGHAGWVTRGAWASDGSRLVTAAQDGRVALWDRDGALLDRAVVEQADPRLQPDGHTVLVVGDDATYRWDTRIEPALVAACRAAGRSMTRLEWRTHVGDAPYRATCEERLASRRTDPR